MPFTSKVANFWKNLTRKPRIEEELNDELCGYVDELTERKVRAGIDPVTARRDSLLEVGGVEQLREETRAQRIGFELETWGRDIRYALRSLRRSPGFMAVAVISLALGIGGVTIAFAIIDPIVLRTLPVPNPEELVTLNAVRGDIRTLMPFLPSTIRSGSGFPSDAFTDLRERNTFLSGMFIYGGTSRNSHLENGQQLQIEQASGGFFTTLEIVPALGRLFTEDDGAGPPMAVISHRLWRNQFAQDEQVIGKTLTLIRQQRLPTGEMIDVSTAYTIIGVAPESFRGIDAGTISDIWIPISARSSPRNPGDFGWWVGLPVVGRLKSGVSLDQVRTELRGIHAQTISEWQERFGTGWNAEQSNWFRAQDLEVIRTPHGMTSLWSRFKQPLLILLTSVAALFIIACANIGALQFARSAHRRREVAVRLAVGGGQNRLVRQFFTESLVLAALGGTVGLAASHWGIQLMLGFAPVLAARSPEVGIGARVFAFTVLISLISALLFGLLPALRTTRTDLNFVFKSGRTSVEGVGSRWAFNKLLIMCQIALSMALLVGAGLFLRTLYNLRHADTGFEKNNIVLFSVNGSLDLGQTLDRLQALPGVESATLWRLGLLRPGVGQVGPIFVEGYKNQPGVDLTSFRTDVGPQFFRTMGVSLLAGRDFVPQDNQRNVAIISSAMARFFFENENAIGRYFRTDPNPKAKTYEVIGVAEDTKYMTLRDQPLRTIYYPIPAVTADSTFALRTRREPGAVAGELTSALLQINPNVRIGKILRMSEVADATLVEEPLIARFATGFSLLALFLVCVGLYGTLSYSVSQRTSEIGIRMALGARIRDVVAMLMRETGWMVGVGLTVGIVITLASTQVIASLLYGLEPADPATLFTAALVLVVVGAFAAYLPARRASRVDPMVALRHE